METEKRNCLPLYMYMPPSAFHKLHVCILYFIGEVSPRLLHVSLFEDVHVTITVVVTSRRERLQRMYTKYMYVLVKAWTVVLYAQ